MSEPLTIENVIPIGNNSHGYHFAVGRMGGRWIGYARCPGDDHCPPMIFVFPGVADGSMLGLSDRDEAIRLTAAIAQDPEEAFGGIDSWFIPTELRGRPEDFRCSDCGALHSRWGPCDPDDINPDNFEDFEAGY